MLLITKTEAAWGADPLEQYGGFQILDYDPHASFASSLSANGTVSWSRLTATASPTAADAHVHLDIGFPEVDWPSIQAVYGWAAHQYQAWARGSISIESEQTFLVHAKGVLEFWIDHVHYFGGDFYAYGRAPVVVRLNAGTHQLDLRLIRDTRSAGSSSRPSVEVDVAFVPVAESLIIDQTSFLFPDVVDGRFVSSLASVAVHNAGPSTASILAVESRNSDARISLGCDQTVHIQPGQTRPLAFNVELIEKEGGAVDFDIIYHFTKSGEDNLPSNKIFDVHHRLTLHHALRHRVRGAPHKITFMHPGGIVSYAIFRPPSNKALASTSVHKTLPILINLHGAGVDTDSDQLSSSLDAIADIPAWTIFPSGVTPWCGDDWHQWGWADVEAAITSIPAWINATKWDGPGANTSRWLVSGHSNGGQGVWYALAHRSENIIAAVPISGYSSIQAYVPYQLWRETDPQKTAILQASLNNYRHELLVPVNAHGIPIAQQHGSADGNVPPFHSRRMHQLMDETENPTKFLELEGKDHWFEGIMTTNFLIHFYEDRLNDSLSSSKSTPNRFSITVADPEVTGPRRGLHIETLITPGRLGRVDVLLGEKTLNISTSNVLSLSLDEELWMQRELRVDGILVSMTSENRGKCLHLKHSGEGTWGCETLKQDEKYSNRAGVGLSSMLGSKGIFRIDACDGASQATALQISRNLMQYFWADSEIFYSCEYRRTHEGNGNVITVITGATPRRQEHKDFAIRIEHGKTVVVTDERGLQHRYRAGEEGLAAIYLRPAEGKRLEVVVWGSDEKSLSVAARLMPLMTGAGQPDFIIMTRKMMWKGLEGVVALGFFDSEWKVSKTSYLE